MVRVHVIVNTSAKTGEMAIEEIGAGCGLVKVYWHLRYGTIVGPTDPQDRNTTEPAPLIIIERKT